MVAAGEGAKALQKISDALKKGAVSMHSTDADGNTLLHLAAK